MTLVAFAQPVHPCAGAGCRELLFKGVRYCRKHQRAIAPLVQEGNTSDRKRWRREGLTLEPLCRCCKVGRGCVRPSKVADHVTPLTRGGDWTAENRQMLCHPCHNYKSALEKAGWVVRLQPGEGFVKAERYAGPVAPRQLRQPQRAAT